MRGLIAFEESQEVTKAFRAQGHDFYSNDLKPCSGGHKEWHLQMDAERAINLMDWDFIGLHCPCTKVAVSGNRWYAGTFEREESALYIKNIFNKANSRAEKTYLENPIGVLPSYIGSSSQIIQPWMFGHGETKATCLCINGLPLLIPTNIVSGRENKIWKMPASKQRTELRSKTYPGIAKAMAEQWTTKQNVKQTELF